VPGSRGSPSAKKLIYNPNQEIKLKMLRRRHHHHHHHKRPLAAAVVVGAAAGAAASRSNNRTTATEVHHVYHEVPSYQQSAQPTNIQYQETINPPIAPYNATPTGYVAYREPPEDKSSCCIIV